MQSMGMRMTKAVLDQRVKWASTWTCLHWRLAHNGSFPFFFLQLILPRCRHHTPGSVRAELRPPGRHGIEEGLCSRCCEKKMGIPGNTQESSWLRHCIPALAHMAVFAPAAARENAVERPPRGVGGRAGMYAANCFVVAWVLIVGFGFGGWASTVNFVRQIDTFGLFTKCDQCRQSTDRITMSA